MSLRRRAWLTAAAGGWLAPAAWTQPRPAVMPFEPPVGEQVLRVAYFHNPALPPAPAGFMDAVLQLAPRLARQWLGLDVRFTGEDRLAMGEAFAAMPPEAVRGFAQEVYGFGGSRGWRWRLVEPLTRHLAGTGRSFPSLLEQAKPFLGDEVEPADLAGLAEALVDTQIRRLGNWQPMFGQDVYHLFPAWLAAAHAGRWPWELIITNQLVASTEYGWVDLASMLRAGVTNGITTQSPASSRGLVSVLTLYPFTANDPTLLALRGGRRGGGEDAVRWAAALLVHELGHQLLHLGHPSNPACVMRAPSDLRFHEWVARLDAGTCPLGSEPQVKPGHLQFRVIRPPGVAPG